MHGECQRMLSVCYSVQVITVISIPTIFAGSPSTIISHICCISKMVCSMIFSDDPNRSMQQAMMIGMYLLCETRTMVIYNGKCVKLKITTYKVVFQKVDIDRRDLDTDRVSPQCL